MLTCKKVSRTLAEKNLDELNAFQRFGLLLHVKLCAMCGPTNRQILQFQDVMKKLRLHTEKDPVAENEPHLPEQTKARIREELKKAG